MQSHYFNLPIILNNSILEPGVPVQEFSATSTTSFTKELQTNPNTDATTTTTAISSTAISSTTSTQPIVSNSLLNARPGQMVRVPENSNTSTGSSAVTNVVSTSSRHSGHSRNSSWDQRTTYSSNGSGRNSQVSFDC